MATYEALPIFGSTSDAAFRAWGAAVSLGFQNCGLVKHTDSGQIDWTTVTRVLGSAEVIVGYEVFRFSDALQATKPVFVKVEYGYYRASDTGPPALWVTVGTGTNGAGTLTGTFTPRTRWVYSGDGAGTSNNGPGSGAATQTSPIFACGDGSGIVMVIGAQTTSQGTLPYQGTTTFFSFPAMLIIERSRDSSGAPTGNGVLLGTALWPSVRGTYTWTDNVAGPTARWQALSFTGASVSAIDTFWPIAWPGPSWSTGADTADLSLFPIRMGTPKVAYPIGLLGTYRDDFAFGSIFDVPVPGGITRKYRSLCGLAGPATNDRARSYVNSFLPLTALLMRWE